MSVNTGGFFFSNPTDVQQHDNRDDENVHNTAAAAGGFVGCGTNAGIINGGYNVPGSLGSLPPPGNFNVNSHAGMLGNIGNNLQHHVVAANNNMNCNLAPNQQLLQQQQQQQQINQGNFLMNTNNINSTMNGNVGGNINMNNMNNTIPVNNTIYGNQSNAPVTMANNNNNNVNVQAPAAGGFGSFFFNPLALFTNNNTNNAAINTTGTVPNPLLNSNNTPNPLGTTNNMVNNNMLNNNAQLLGVYQQNQQQQNQQQQQQPMQQHQQMQIVPTAAATATTTSTLQQPINTQFINNINNGAPSPIPLAFMTPNQGPTPCPPTPPTPMFHDANSVLLPDNNNQFQVGGNTFMENNNPLNGTLQDSQQQQQHQQQQQQQGGTPPSKTTTTTTTTPTSSLFRTPTRNIISSLMGSALGAVATYVNQSFLSGIPFHIADRAMKESKEIYAKWWEDGINDYNKKKRRKERSDRKRGGGGEDDDMDEDSDSDDDGGPAGKKRKLDSNNNNEEGGSSLSMSLKKNYDDMGIDTSSRFIEYGEYGHQQQEEQQQQQQQQLQQEQQWQVVQQHDQQSFAVSYSHSCTGNDSNNANNNNNNNSSNNMIDVDSSIIRRRGGRRSQFEQRGSSSSSTSRGVGAHEEEQERRKPLIANSSTSAEAIKEEGEHVMKKEDQVDGYNAFNNIGGMYDFGGDDDDDNDNNNEERKKTANIGGNQAMTMTTTTTGGDNAIDQLMYDSLGSYYGTNEDSNENHDGNNNEGLLSSSGAEQQAQAPAAVATATIISNDTTTTTSHLDGTLQVISELLEEKNRASEENELLEMLSSPRDWVKKSIRSELIDALQTVQGDVKDKRFLSSLEILGNFYKTSGRDARVSPWCGRRSLNDPGIDGGSYGYSGSEVGGPTASDLLEGNWVNLSRPNYIECLGKNTENDFMYTLGRMSFDMFQPGGLICSVQSTHNTIKIIGEREELPAFIPKSLKEEVASLCDSGNEDGTAKRPLLRSYDIAVSLTIEPPASVGQPEPPATPTPTKRMRALMSVKGYVLPDPDTPNRLTVWFTGGKLSPARLAADGVGEMDDDEDQAEYNDQPPCNNTKTAEAAPSSDEGYGGFEDWTAMFAKGKWRKTLGERARAMAAKLLLGADVPNKMEEDGHMEYTLHRPVGGHAKVYVDVLYLDEDILIMRGHHGTIYAMARSGVSQRYRAMRGKSANVNH
ncbi:hypothetical protein ACHAXR_011885 [Thalassiosira sp. AJA248-18]